MESKGYQESTTTSALPTDEQLLLDFQQGDQAAFATIVERHEVRLARIAYRIVGCRHEAEDARHAVFVRFLQQIGQSRQLERVGAWLTRCTVNEAITRARQKKSGGSRDGGTRDTCADRRGCGTIGATTSRRIARAVIWRVKCIAEDLCRLEQPNGIYLVFDVKGKRVMEVNPNESKVRFIENIPVPKNFNIISKLANVKVLAVKNEPGLPNREIGGKETTGFVIEENGVQFNVWIDPATNLPLEMERRLPSTGQRIESSSTEKWTKLSSMEKWTDFRFDEPLDKALFALEVPEGFAVDTRNSATKEGAKEGAPESYGFGQEVKPNAKQE